VIALSAGSWYVVNAPRRNLVLTRQAQVVRLQHPRLKKSIPQSVTPKHCWNFAYSEAPQELQPIVADGSIKLRKTAAIKFQEMVAARAAGVVGLFLAFAQLSLRITCFLSRLPVVRSNKRAAVSAPLVIANIILVTPWILGMGRYQRPT